MIKSICEVVQSNMEELYQRSRKQFVPGAVRLFEHLSTRAAIELFFDNRMKGHCDVSLPVLNQLGYWYDRQRTQLWDKGRLRNDLQWISGFLSCCFWMFPKQLRKKSELVGSEEIRRVKTRHRKNMRSFGQILWKVFQ